MISTRRSGEHAPVNLLSPPKLVVGLPLVHLPNKRAARSRDNAGIVRSISFSGCVNDGHARMPALRHPCVPAQGRLRRMCRRSPWINKGNNRKACARCASTDPVAAAAARPALWLSVSATSAYAS